VGAKAALRWRWAAGVSAAAALVHTVAIDEHLREWWGYGLFFLFASLAQMFYAVLLLLRPWRRTPPGAEDDLWERRALWAGVLGNALLILLYVVSRTVGVPFLGPAAGRVEEVSALGVVSKALEAWLITLLVVMLRAGPSETETVAAAPATS
jgi:hypothetical protein